MFIFREWLKELRFSKQINWSLNTSMYFVVAARIPVCLLRLREMESPSLPSELGDNIQRLHNAVLEQRGTRGRVTGAIIGPLELKTEKEEHYQK